MFHRRNRIALAAGITVTVIAAMAGPASARAPAAAAPNSAASTPVPVDITGDLTWTENTTENTAAVNLAEKYTGTFHIDLTNVTNGGQAAGGDSSTYSYTHNYYYSSVIQGYCSTTTTGSSSGSGPLLYPNGGIDVSFNPSMTAITLYIGLPATATEEQTTTNTGIPGVCDNGTTTNTVHLNAGVGCVPQPPAAFLWPNGSLNGTYPNATVNVGCSETFTIPTPPESGSSSVTGTLTITPSCGSAATSQAEAHTASRPTMSTPGSGNTGGLSVTIDDATALPPPQPANQEPFGAYFSIPRPGQQNAWQRFYDLTYTVTEGSADVTGTAKVTNATVELDSANGSTLQQNIVNEGRGSDLKVLSVGCNIIQVQVTYSGGTTSTVASTPPPTNQIKYKFTLSAQDPANGDSGTSAAFTSEPVYALWKMPDGLPRYGPCGEADHQKEGPGGDNWVSQSTYNWMVANRGLLPAINDTTFEHGMNLGPHQTHGTGNDMDLFHAYRNLAGANHCSGTAYYDTLVQTVRNALAGNHAATQQVTNWVDESRAWFDQVIPMTQVSYIRYARGLAVAATTTEPGLPLGWAEDLLTNGTFTNAEGQTLTVAGAWGNAHNKMTYATDHDNHIHLALVACTASTC